VPVIGLDIWPIFIALIAAEEREFVLIRGKKEMDFSPLFSKTKSKGWIQSMKIELNGGFFFSLERKPLL